MSKSLRHKGCGGEIFFVQDVTGGQWWGLEVGERGEVDLGKEYENLDIDDWKCICGRCSVEWPDFYDEVLEENPDDFDVVEVPEEDPARVLRSASREECRDERRGR